MDMRQVTLFVVEAVLAGKALSLAKKEAAKKFGLATIPTNIELLTYLTNTEKKKYHFLLTKPMRTLSGVAPLAVMTKPFPCPHGRCTFCPGGVGSFFGDVTQSYTGHEPSSLRAMRAHYDSYLIVFNRLEQYILLDQVPEKAEVIIQGGTFPSYDLSYQREFVAFIFKALNDFSTLFFVDGTFNYSTFKTFFELPGTVKDPLRTERIQKKILALKGVADLCVEQKRNETASIRCVGLTVETKPDWGFASHGQLLLDLGCTRVELGVQSVYEDVLRKTHRGHTLSDTRKSFADLLDLGFKINAHYMIGLYVNAEKDLAGLRALLSDFCPDMLKIYPCLVMSGTPLYDQWKRGEFQTLSWEDAAEIISEFKRSLPPFLRIQRIQRDIPSTVISAGPIRTNLRQEVTKLCKEKRIVCPCIRCREPKSAVVGTSTLSVFPYDANGGKEFFIQAVCDGFILGFCRLRFPGQFLRSEITPTSALLRELHVYGAAAALGTSGMVQHQGLGKQLLTHAEKICCEHGKNKLVVIAGIGVKEYYRKLSYVDDGSYVSKKL